MPLSTPGVKGSVLCTSTMNSAAWGHGFVTITVSLMFISRLSSGKRKLISVRSGSRFKGTTTATMLKRLVWCPLIVYEMDLRMLPVLSEQSTMSKPAVEPGGMVWLSGEECRSSSLSALIATWMNCCRGL